MGKTSLLRRAQLIAEELGLATVFVTAGNGVLSAVITDEIEQLTRDVLVAMAAHPGGPVPRRAIAASLGVESTALSMARQSLMHKGIVHAPEHGMLAFTVPGFGRYVRDIADADPLD